jgi:hypothetical protein
VTRGAFMRAWRVIDHKRGQAVDRRMRREPMNVAGAVRQVHDDGAAWLTDLAADYGGDIEALSAVVAEVDRESGDNLLTLAAVGALDARQMIHAAIAAGFASGYFVRAELERAAQEKAA